MPDCVCDLAANQSSRQDILTAVNVSAKNTDTSMFVCAQAICHINITYSTCLVTDSYIWSWKRTVVGLVTGDELAKQTIVVPVVVALVSLSLLDIFKERRGRFQMCL